VNETAAAIGIAWPRTKPDLWRIAEAGMSGKEKIYLDSP
jgi:hypothetical protein